MKKNLIKWIIWLMQMAMFFLPMLVIPLLSFNSLNPKKLSGTYWLSDPPRLSFQRLSSGDYSHQINNYLKETWSYRAFFVRLKNQIDYGIFNQSSNERIVVGKNGQLFEKAYAEAWMGDDLLAKDSARMLVQKLVDLKKELKLYDTKVLVLTPPGTPTVKSNQLPSFYNKENGHPTNRKQFSALFKELNIKEENFHFLLEKGDDYFSRGGLHWSHWGATIAADSFYNRLIKIDSFPPIHWAYQKDGETDWKGTDFELERAMNLLKKLPPKASFKPLIDSKSDSLNQKKKVIVIGDSYYKVWYDLGIHTALFSKDSEFWYYGRTIFPKRMIGQKEALVSDLNVLEEWQKADLIIFQVSETNLPRLGFELLR